MTTINTITCTQVRALADSHIRRFENLLNSGRANVRRDECQMYLDIWKDALDSASVEDDEMMRARLSRRERQEIQDAIDCGDYDDLLSLNASGEESP